MTQLVEHRSSVREFVGSRTLRVFKLRRRKCYLCNEVCKWLDFQVFSDKDDKPKVPSENTSISTNSVGRKRTHTHWTKKCIYIKFAQRKYDAKICLLQSKPVANAVKAIFATIFAHQCEYDTKYGLYGVCYRFALEQTYFCIIFALSKFDVNPFHFFVQ